MQQRTDEWHKARIGRVTGSAVGAILGLAPYMTRADALRAMVREYHGAEREFTGNVATEYGTANEATAIACYEMESGNDVVSAPFVPYEDWLGASPDGYIGDDALIECKCPYGLRSGGDFKSIKDQPHYYAQIQVQLFVTGRSECHFYQWAPHGSMLEIVPRDWDWIDRTLPALRQFHAEYLSELDNPEHLEPLRVSLNTLEAKRMLDEIDQLKEAIDNATERKKELEAKLVDMAGNRNAEIWGRKLTLVERAGNVQYGKIPELKGVDLDKYRGKPSSYWKLS